ncbi:MAG: hypothetical protein V3S01_01010 [Dehalococcoidia bacterium]
MSPLKLICGWCKKDQGTMAAKVDGVSTTICAGCLAYHHPETIEHDTLADATAVLERAVEEQNELADKWRKAKLEGDKNDEA